MSKVNTMINLSYKEEISEDTLADFIKNLKNFDDERMEVLFTEVPITDLIQWCLQKNIDFETLKEYYEKFIKTKGLRNPYLEGFFEI
ncbi:MAG: hypothetical protein ACP5G3_05275 [Sulfurihydrogenibium sp.]|uniref:Uncharacterized protein n=1 Tax=Sulfurihydrogenibium azorense TaxID=309806 RepID=A0A831YDI4_9AQUI|nr:MAG: hypothetical protein C0198_02790 [Sulfurihydrogenibium sp.]HEV08896.1 hypothetical protein [Sulfurihydrogenibium azorense]